MLWASSSTSQQTLGTPVAFMFHLEMVGEKVPILRAVTFFMAGEEATSCCTDIRKLFPSACEAWCYLQNIEMHLPSFISSFYNSRCLLFLVIGCFLQRWFCFSGWIYPECTYHHHITCIPSLSVVPLHERPWFSAPGLNSPGNVLKDVKMSVVS